MVLGWESLLKPMQQPLGTGILSMPREVKGQDCFSVSLEEDQGWKPKCLTPKLAQSHQADAWVARGRWIVDQVFMSPYMWKTQNTSVSSWLKVGKHPPHCFLGVSDVAEGAHVLLYRGHTCAMWPLCPLMGQGWVTALISSLSALTGPQGWGKSQHWGPPDVSRC